MGDFSFGSLELSSDDFDGIVSSYRKGSDAVSLSEFSRNVGTHDSISKVARSVVVSYSVFSSRAGYLGISLHSIYNLLLKLKSVILVALNYKP